MILFAVTLSSILLAIALGVANIALKEIRFGTSAKDTSNAFFASDTGIECALLGDKTFASSPFKPTGGASSIECLGGNVSINGNYPSFNFVVSGLGSSGQSCANVTIFKDEVIKAPAVVTTVVSKGYNIQDVGDPTCSSSNPNRVEREIKVTY